MPSISHLGCNAGMTGLAECHEVLLIMAAATRKRQDMVNFCRFGQPARLSAFFAKRMPGKELCPYLSPGTPIPAPGSWITAIFLILLTGQLCMFFAVPICGKLCAARIPAGMFRPCWHHDHLSLGKQKALEGFLPEGFIVHSFFASLILSDFAMNIY